ncbi:hypothetical protein NECAME_11479 [Necator americanus]|uniref:Anoctamin n=1 Tax=Necator americanus TaxID=51031 RepID=W2T4G9_NECAM|nr:hypothetical protein NECAME_11479 [Necator americanus]ETN76763.1 hypothetical protein NECAME_11479 [Necator americanus]
MQQVVSWLVDIIKTYEPHLRIEVRHHNLKDCYALYLTANYKSLLKGAELCHIKKQVKSRFGGGLREFSFEEAQCFSGIEGRNTFLTDMERAFIVKQLVDMIRAPSGGLTLQLPTKKVRIREGMAVVPRLISANLIENMLPLHSSEFLKHLQHKWVLSIDEQPLDEIRDYFGTEIAMYFSWLGHLTTALWFPALLGTLSLFYFLLPTSNLLPPLTRFDSEGLLMYFVGFAYKTKPDVKQNTSQLFYDICFVCFAFFNCVWSTAYLESWKRKQAELAFRWGTYDNNCDSYLQDPRPQFQGEYFAPNPVSGRVEPYYPPWKHAIVRYENYRTDDEYEDFLISKIVIFQFVTAFGSLFYIAFYLKDMKRLQETLATLLITRQITQNVMETVVPFLVEKVKLSQLTYKMTKSMSNTSLRRHVEEVRKKNNLSESELRGPQQSRPYFTIEPSSSQGIRKRFSQRRLAGRENELHLLENLNQTFAGDEAQRSARLPLPEFKPSGSGAPELTQAELESLMAVYDRPLDDYLEMFIQFGYVLLFSPAFPLAALCAVVNNVVEIRVDAFKLCNTVQRPFGRQVKDVGAWQKAMELLGMVGVMVNCALIGQSGLVQRIYPDLSWGGQVLIVVVLEHIILASKIFIDLAVPDVPHWIRIETAKQEHFRREAFKRESRMISSSKMGEGDSSATVDLPRPQNLAENRLQRRSVTPVARMSQFKRDKDSNCIDDSY